PSDLGLLRGEDVACLLGAFAGSLACGQQLATGTLSECFGPEAAEHLVCGAQLMTCVHAATLASEPLAVEQTGPGELDANPGALQPLDRFAVERVRVLPSAHQCL